MRQRYNRLKAEHDLVKARLVAAKADADKARAQRLDIDVVQRVLQTSAAMVQNNFGTYISGIVTKAMHHVFPERVNDTFVVRFRENRGQTECQLLIRSQCGSEAHPFTCAGGGVWDVLAFALRAVVLVLEQPRRSKFMVCDEPFKNLHGKDARENALDMLYNTCKSLGIQCLVVHQSDGKEGDDDNVLASYSKDGARVYKVRQTAYETSVIEVV